jgi:zinc transport system ATP-binding protein
MPDGQIMHHWASPDTAGAVLLHTVAMTKRFGGLVALDKLDLEVSRGSICSIIGPNGAGKTTLIKIAMGLLSPSDGQVLLAPDLRIGFMPQRLTLSTTLPISVERFLELGTHAAKGGIAQALAEVGATNLIRTRMQDLSGGELQRVLLARALLQQPDLLVLDEPTQGVDLKGQAELYRLIMQIRERHRCGVLMVSHDLHLVMAATDEVICLNQHVCCHGHPSKVSSDPAYLELFGKRDADTMAFYTHYHTHHHELSGDVVSDEDGH